MVQSTGSQQPPLLLASRVDYFARERPSRVYISIQRTANAEDGFRDITYRELARSVDWTAHWLDEQLGQRQAIHETVTYIGTSDLRCPILMLAAIKTDRVVSGLCRRLLNAGCGCLTDYSFRYALHT